MDSKIDTKALNIKIKQKPGEALRNTPPEPPRPSLIVPEKLRQERNEIEILKGKLNDSEKLQAQKEGVIAQLKEKLDSLNLHIRQIQAENQELKWEGMKLPSNLLLETSAQINPDDQRITDRLEIQQLKQQKDSMKYEIDSLKQQMKQMKYELDQRSKQLNQLKLHIKEKDQKLQEITHLKLELQEQIDLKTKGKDQTLSKVTQQLKLQIKQKDKKLSDLIQQIKLQAKVKDQKISHLTEQLKLQIQEKDQKLLEVRQLKLHIQEKDSKVQQLTRLLNMSKDQIEGNLKKVVSEKQDSSEKMVAFQKSLQLAKKEIGELKNKIKSKQNQKINLLKEESELRDQYNSVLRQKKDLERRLISKQQELTELKLQMPQSNNTQLEDLRNQFNNYKRQVALKLSGNFQSDLKNQLDSYKREIVLKLGNCQKEKEKLIKFAKQLRNIIRNNTTLRESKMQEIN